MNMYRGIIATGLSFTYVKRISEERPMNKFFTRGGWSGIYFYNEGRELCCITKNGELIADVFMSSIIGQNERDWMFVEPNEFAEGLIKELKER